jgi:hypothetical protein
MFICCGSGLLSRNVATSETFAKVGWGDVGDGSGRKIYSAQRAVAISIPAGVFFGMALAGVGLGLQAQHRRAPLWAVGVTTLAAAFFAFNLIFAAIGMKSFVFSLIAGGLTIFFVVLLLFSIGALRDMRAHPPPADLEILPLDYKVPYSHLHQDPPEVRLARELEQRRQRLAVEQKELEMLEEKLKRKADR